MDNNWKNQESMMREDRKEVVDNIVVVVVVVVRRMEIGFEDRNNYLDQMKHHLNKRMKEKRGDHHDESRISHVYSSF